MIPNTIFLSSYMGFITIPFFINHVLPTLQHPVTLIIASEDYTFPTGKGDVRLNFYATIQDKINILFTLKSQCLKFQFKM